MKRIQPPSDSKIKNLSKKIDEAHAIQNKFEKKMNDLIKDYIQDCKRRNNEGALSVLVDKMPKNYFGSFYIFYSMNQIKERKERRKKNK